MKKPLGRLEVVELRNYWESEDREFTPWLAQDENIRILGEAIGLDLEVEAQEKDVGPFRADILCKDTATEKWVLIENQLERTNHAHLGQLLTYAAGLDAVTIVWVAKRFTEEHRAALDWLNAITEERFNFFGLEIELWQIGDGPAAPKFNVISKPNDWTKVVRESASTIRAESLTQTRKLQLEFWTAFVGYLADSGSRLKTTKPAPQHWMHVALGRAGVHLTAIASAYSSATQSYEIGELRAEVEIQNLSHADAIFSPLYQEKDRIETEFGESLVWHRPTDAAKRRIYIQKQADISARDEWPEMHRWLREKLEKLDRVFRERVKRIDSSQRSGAEK